MAVQVYCIRSGAPDKTNGFVARDARMRLAASFCHLTVFRDRGARIRHVEFE
jgi:hypothetical protein